ncbi:MAG: pseudouridine synthase [Bacteroidota bacterium]
MSESKHVLYKLYKPYGYISQFISNQPKSHKKRFLGELYDFPEGTMAIGRLDEHSEGLLLLTTDGKLSDTVNSSSFEKEYYAMVDGIISTEAIAQLSQGIAISIHGKPYTTKPCKVKKLPTPSLPSTPQRIRDERHGPTSWISITLTEGKYRQIRKMTSAVGFPTLRLARVRIGKLTVGSMKAGDCKVIEETTL